MPVEQDRLGRQWEPLLSASGTGGDVRTQGDAGDSGAPARCAQGVLAAGKWPFMPPRHPHQNGGS